MTTNPNPTTGYPGGQAKVGSQMSYWIGYTLKEAREHANVSDRDIATTLGVDRRTILRLEDGDSLGRDIDRTVAAYAYVIGLDDARELWMRAIRRFTEDGTAPAFMPANNPALNFAREIRAEALRRRRAERTQSRDGQPEMRRATHRRATDA